MSNNLINSGNQKMDWARNHMPVMAAIREEFIARQPLKGRKIGMALHLEAKTAVLAETMALGGAEVAITGCNPLSTQDDVSAALNTRDNVSCYAKYNCTIEEYYAALDKVLDFGPNLTVDDGGDLIFKIHTERPHMLQNLLGSCEETTTGVHRLQAMDREGALKIPVIAVNDAMTKHMFDNRYGTGQSSWDGIMRTTNLLVTGQTVVIAGYGWCGKGAAMRARGLGANVIVTEIDPIKALEARMDGNLVMPMLEAVKQADIILSVTGNRDIVRKEHFKVIKDGAILSNAGHFNVEISIEDLVSMAKSVKTVRKDIQEYDLGDRKVYVLAEGRLVNLAAGDGHPAEVMDMSFADQALCIKHLVENKLPPGVHPVPLELDMQVVNLKLKAMGVEFDTLTPIQKDYIDSWQSGT